MLFYTHKKDTEKSISTFLGVFCLCNARNG